MLKQCILSGRQSLHCPTPVTEEFLSHLIDGAQRTGFVIHYDCQSPKLLELLTVNIQLLEEMLGQGDKYLCCISIGLLGPPSKLLNLATECRCCVAN